MVGLVDGTGGADVPRLLSRQANANRKGEHMNREQIDIMWNRALQQAIKDGEEFTRYHFAALVAAAEREACAYRAGIALLGADRGLANRVDQAIRARGQA